MRVSVKHRVYTFPATLEAFTAAETDVGIEISYPEDLIPDNEYTYCVSERTHSGSACHR